MTTSIPLAPQRGDLRGESFQKGGIDPVLPAGQHAAADLHHDSFYLLQQFLAHVSVAYHHDSFLKERILARFKTHGKPLDAGTALNELTNYRWDFRLSHIFEVTVC